MTQERLQEHLHKMSQLLGVSVELEVVGPDGFLYVDRKLETKLSMNLIDQIIPYIELGIRIKTKVVVRQTEVLAQEIANKNAEWRRDGN